MLLRALMLMFLWMAQKRLVTLLTLLPLVTWCCLQVIGMLPLLRQIKASGMPLPP